MNTKLTLQLDKSIIERAKNYASQRKVSLSKIIESYLHLLTSGNTNQQVNDIDISPLIKELSGVIHLPNDFDYQSEYGDHLIEKYK